MPIRRRGYYRAAKQSYSVYKNTRALTIATPHGNDNINNNRIIRSTSIVMARNAVANGNYIPPVMKVKHVKVQVTIPPVDQNILQGCIQMRFVVVFLPEGMNLTVEPQIVNNVQQYTTTGTLDDHPEWIMGERLINFNSVGSTLTSINCRINRNLKTGDSIAVVGIAYFQNGFNQNSNIPCICSCSYACRSN